MKIRTISADPNGVPVAMLTDGTLCAWVKEQWILILEGTAEEKANECNSHN